MADSFAVAAAKAPNAVRTLVLTLAVTEGVPRQYAAGYRFEVLDAAGEVLELREGNLVPHITATQQNQLKAFVDAMLAKAQAVIS